MSITPEQLVADLHHFDHIEWARIVERVIAERNEAVRQRNDLLARIFRDGGQKAASFPSVQEACEAADTIVADMFTDREST